MKATVSNRYSRYLLRAVASQKSAIRFQLVLAVSVIVLGAFLLITSRFIVRETNSKGFEWMTTIGAGFFSLLSGFPIKEIFQRRDRLDALRVVAEQLESSDASDVAIAEQYVVKMLEKAIVG